MVGSQPTSRLLAGLVVILLAVAMFSYYSLQQIDGLRRLQLETVDRNRKDSLVLLRIQNNLQNLALSMRDMAEGSAGYPIAAWQAEFERVHFDLDDALRLESELGPTSRTPEQQKFLQTSLSEFWKSVEEMFRLAAGGNETDAEHAIRVVVQPRLASIANTVARFLVLNNEAEQAATEQIQGIYSNVERNVYYFLMAVFAAIFVTGTYMVVQNRHHFQSLALLSQQRQVLARRLITVQEDLFQSIARELHDEFGQTLTAVGALLTRLERKTGEAPPGLKEGLIEVKGVAQDALDRVRQLSQRLHPHILDDYGLEGAAQWYVRQIGEQTGLQISYEKFPEPLPAVPHETAIHVYRILQESLSNVVRHANSSVAWVRLGWRERALCLEIEDRGVGLPPESERKEGLGLVAMRERAELIQGRLTFSRPAEGGSMVSLEVPMTRSS